MKWFFLGILLKITSSSCKMKSYLWNKEYCTLHPLIVCFIDSDGSIQHRSLCCISDDNNHNKNFVYKIQYVSCIYNTFWWVGIVTEVNVHEGDLKIEFLHPHGPRKTFIWPSVADKCFVSVSNILCIITAPTTITGQIYRISDTDLKAYENFESIWKP